MRAIKWTAVEILFVCLAGLTGCSMAGEKNREVREYLESRYGSQDFEITKLENDGTYSYQVVPAEYPEAAFTVEEGKIEESQDWNFHDDYAACMLYGGAERLGLTYEKGKNGYDVFITYENYSSIDEVAEKVEQLVADCIESHAFDKLRNTCLITIKPEYETNPVFPGYEIRVKTLYTYPVDKVFGVMASGLIPGQLKENLRLCHIYNAYQYSIPRDSAMFSEYDIEKCYEMCSGAMSTADDGSISIYRMVDKASNGLSFGGAYQILLSEGLITEETEESFIASGNGVTIEFFRRFDVLTSDKMPGVSYEILSGSETLSEIDLSILSGGNAVHSAVDLLADKVIEFSTPEKIAAAAEEERLSRLPLVQEAFSQAVSLGEMTSGASMEVTVTGVETYERLQGSNSSYVDSNEDMVWTGISIRIKNTGSTEMYLFSLWSDGSEGKLVGIIADEEANLYRFTDIINLGLENIYSYNLQAGDTVEGNIYIKLPRELIMKEDALVLWIFRGADSVSVLLPAVN